MLSLFSVCARSVYYQQHQEKAFLEWMRTTNNMFTGDVYQTRFGIWMSNQRLVQEHNKAGSYKVEMNHLSHYTPSEYKALLGYKMDKKARVASKASNFKAPDAIDWRDKGVVNTIKDQAQCGS